MRVWDISVQQLCDKHLIAQHHEIHCIHNIIKDNKWGFRNHPEVIRWKGHIPALCAKHFITVMEMESRGMSHRSSLFTGSGGIDVACPPSWQPVEEQIEILKAKDCDCLREVTL